MGLLVSSYALLDYERYERSSSVELLCLDGLICPEDGLRRLLHGERSWGCDRLGRRIDVPEAVFQTIAI